MDIILISTEYVATTLLIYRVQCCFVRDIGHGQWMSYVAVNFSTRLYLRNP